MKKIITFMKKFLCVKLKNSGFIKKKYFTFLIIFLFLPLSSMFGFDEVIFQNLNITSMLKFFDLNTEKYAEKLNSIACSYNPSKIKKSSLYVLQKTKPVWTKAKISNFKGEGVLEIRSRKISQLCAFHYSETQRKFISLPFYSYDWIQKLAFRYYHIYIPKLSEPLELYLFVQQDIPHSYDIWLYSKEKFLDEQRTRNFIFGIYYGFVIIFLIFSLLLFLTTKELSQLYYFFLVIGLVFTDAYFSGNLKLVLDEFFKTNVFFERGILLFTQIFTLLLLNEVIKHSLIRTYKINSILQNSIFLIIIIIPIIVFVPEKVFLPIFYLLSLVIICFILWVFFQALFTREVMSIILMFSFLVLILTSLINILVVLNVLPTKLYIQDNIKIGISVLIFVHSILLSYKTYINQRQLLESTYLLEQKIYERTIQLSKTIEELREKDLNFQSHLNLASELQRSLFPNQSQKYPLIEFQIFQKGILQVVGDFFDIISHKDGSIAFFIADASGHGVPAALLTTLCKITIRETVLKNSEPAEALVEIHNRLINVLIGNNFITLFLFTLTSDGNLKYSNAGHNPLFLYRTKTQSLEPLLAKGAFLGIQTSHVFFEQKQTQIQKGDRIFLFTDGFTYLMNIKNKQLAETLKNIFLKNQSPSLQESFEKIIHEWRFYKSEKKEEDVTFIIVEYTG